jgi:hypothetical protein
MRSVSNKSFKGCTVFGVHPRLHARNMLDLMLDRRQHRAVGDDRARHVGDAF